MTAIIINFILGCLFFGIGYVVMDTENVPLWKQLLVAIAFIIGAKF
ncbi:hypothetical protein [Bacillus toyonensis]|nr:hypothetical protein [Bacillus toyonensis]